MNKKMSVIKSIRFMFHAGLAMAYEDLLLEHGCLKVNDKWVYDEHHNPFADLSAREVEKKLVIRWYTKMKYNYGLCKLIDSYYQLKERPV